MQYADFAAWQRQWPQQPSMQAQLAYWRAQLHEPLPVLTLPTDRPRRTTLPLRTARQPLELPGTLFTALTNLSQRQGCTLFMTCFAAVNMLLYGYTGQEDVCVATLVANRPRPGTEGMIGLCVNTVLLRTDLSGQPTCREVLRRVRATTLGAYAHQELPFEELLRSLEHERRLQRTSLAQLLVIWQNTVAWPGQFSAHTLRFQDMDQSMVLPSVSLTTFDIILVLHERPHALSGTCIYKTDLFDETTVRRMLGDFSTVLTGLSAQPEQPLATWRCLHQGA
jgi:non-ribosomal peptide synthetase component F